MGDLHAPVNTAHDQALFAPVELECFAQLEPQRHECFDIFAGICPPSPDVVGDSAVAAKVAAGLDLDKQCPSGAPVLFVAAGISLEGLLQLLSKGAQFAKSLGPHVLGYFDFLGSL